ncbi:hypothetical protein GCM10009678_49830 [Actinomadura kijaniata]
MARLGGFSWWDDPGHARERVRRLRQGAEAEGEAPCRRSRSDAALARVAVSPGALRAEGLGREANEHSGRFPSPPGEGFGPKGR